MNCTTAEFERAKTARKLCHAMGAPSLENCKKMLRSNQIKDCPAAEKDAELVEAIFGPGISTLKGRTPHKTPKAIAQDLIAVPPELARNHSSIDLCIDIMCMNKFGFMTFIGCPSHCWNFTMIKGGNKDTLHSCLDKTL